MGHNAVRRTRSPATTLPPEENPATVLDPFVAAPATDPTAAEAASRRSMWLRALVLAGAVGVLVAGTVTAGASAGGEASKGSGGGRPAHADLAPPASPKPAAVEPTAEVAPAAEPPPAPATGPAYRVASADGGVFTHGWFGFAGSAAGAAAAPVVGLAHAVDGDGYWLASADGGVFAFGNAPFQGSAVGASASPIIDIASTPSHGGYWLVSAAGGVFAFGDATFHGAAVELGLGSRIVAMAPTSTGAGYWLASADGGVFAYGDAGYLGGLAGTPASGRIVDIVPTASGDGYYLVAADGGVFAYGDAVYHGGANGKRRPSPVVDMALHPDGRGYWLLSRDGGVFSYGEAPFLGAPIAHRTRGSFIAIAGGVGRHQPPPEPAPVEPAASAPPATAAPAAADGGGVPHGHGHRRSERLLDNEFGWDISYPQCGGRFPSGPMAFSIIGVNGGRAFKHNRCLGEQWRWARSQGAAGIYVNVHHPRSAHEQALGASSDRQPNCNGAAGCVAYNFAFNGIRDSLQYARSQGVEAPFVWLDVEQLNYWAPEQELNAVVIRGAIDAVREAGMGVGIYSTPYQYRKITGDEQAQVPVWSAGAPGAGAVETYCATRGFGGGRVVIVQLLPGEYDPNFACPGAGPMAQYFVMP